MNQRESCPGDRKTSRLFSEQASCGFPMDKDGYPQQWTRKNTGVIDTTVAAYWRKNYDLTYIINRDWNKIGSSLRGKIHIYVGDMDTYYLNDAVYTAEEMLKKLNNPNCNCEVDYGDRAEHCWNGDHTQPNSGSLTRRRVACVLRLPRKKLR